jgi:hypothetical protein
MAGPKQPRLGESFEEINLADDPQKKTQEIIEWLALRGPSRKKKKGEPSIKEVASRLAEEASRLGRDRGIDTDTVDWRKFRRDPQAYFDEQFRLKHPDQFLQSGRVDSTSGPIETISGIFGAGAAAAAGVKILRKKLAKRLEPAWKKAARDIWDDLVRVKSGPYGRKYVESLERGKRFTRPREIEAFQTNPIQRQRMLRELKTKGETYEQGPWTYLSDPNLAGDPMRLRAISGSDPVRGLDWAPTLNPKVYGDDWYGTRPAWQEQLRRTGQYLHGEQKTPWWTTGVVPPLAVGAEMGRRQDRDRDTREAADRLLRATIPHRRY